MGALGAKHQILGSRATNDLEYLHSRSLSISIFLFLTTHAVSIHDRCRSPTLSVLVFPPRTLNPKLAAKVKTSSRQLPQCNATYLNATKTSPSRPSTMNRPLRSTEEAAETSPHRQNSKRCSSGRRRDATLRPRGPLWSSLLPEAIRCGEAVSADRGNGYNHYSDLRWLL